eukprot:GHUV01007834.1.p1 GENE.GHUV01007834.1~~GHUV01007834.1.p1  ORF type:complete len:152 (+),score=15.49 GHUV01007834.1:108-563(+)
MQTMQCHPRVSLGHSRPNHHGGEMFSHLVRAENRHSMTSSIDQLRYTRLHAMACGTCMLGANDSFFCTLRTANPAEPLQVGLVHTIVLLEQSSGTLYDVVAPQLHASHMLGVFNKMGHQLSPEPIHLSTSSHQWLHHEDLRGWTQDCASSL